MDEGLAKTVLPEVPLKPVPGLQVYVLAPLAVSVAVPPGQIVALLTVTVGVGVTVTETVALLLQPLADPVTVNVCVDEGATDTVLVVALPAFALHVYVLAPLPVSVTDCPLQIVVAEVLAVTTGKATTVTVEVLDELHEPELPVTVYTLVEVGLTVMVEAIAPVLQVYVEAPPALSAAEEPAQIVALFTVTVRLETTLTVEVDEPLHPLVVPVTV